MKIWISVFIPEVGADIYEGARVQPSLSEEECYRDLAEWLNVAYENNDQVVEVLNEKMDEEDVPVVRFWKVDCWEVSQ